MILRKPYKFLIKHFKIIHLLLFLPILYLIIRTNGIFTFFNNYVKNHYSYTVISNLAGSTVNLFMYLAVLLIVIISLIVYYLMRQKKKNTKLYIGMIVYYLILFVSFTVFYGVLSGLESAELSAKASRAYRDISLLISLPQYFFAFYSIFRGLGFDIKSFKFELDLKDLDISEEDNEEFEFVVGIETYKYKRTVRRFIREFKYYVLENKFVFSVICSILGLILITALYIHFNVYNKVYTQNKDFAHNSFGMNMLGSMMTNVDYNGKTIVKGKYYLVLKLEITNNSLLNQELDLDNFRLQVKDGYVVPTPDISDFFIDFGTPYHGEKIKKGTTTIYNIAYELTKEQVKSTYKLKILESIDYKIGDISARYKILSIRPKEYLEQEQRTKYNLKDKIDMTGSMLDYTTVKVNDYEIGDTYIYKYKKCEKSGECRELDDVVASGYTNSTVPTTLLVLGVDTDLDKDVEYANAIKSMNSFYEDFFTVEYDGFEFLTKNVTPANLKDKVVLLVPKALKDANNINLLITVREKTYEVKLK